MKKRDSIGKKLPTEERLMKAFGVSRDTVRRALQALENSGKISRTRGKGTVITSSTSQEQLTSIRSFTEQMRIENHVPITKVVEVKKIKAD
jgi:GntR family transcriptional regulator